MKGWHCRCWLLRLCEIIWLIYIFEHQLFINQTSVRNQQRRETLFLGLKWIRTNKMAFKHTTKTTFNCCPGCTIYTCARRHGQPVLTGAASCMQYNKLNWKTKFNKTLNMAACCFLQCRSKQISFEAWLSVGPQFLQSTWPRVKWPMTTLS